jgi:hypothetical protein
LLFPVPRFIAWGAPEAIRISAIVAKAIRKL